MTAVRELWTSKDALRAIGGHNGVDWAAGNVSIDTRTLEPGDLFVALDGPNFDGHDFVAAALAAGAAAAVVHRLPANVPDGAPLLVVDDTLSALAALGRAARARAGARIVGVTGSVGKTGTKEMLKLALGALGPTHASGSSLNNEIGVPLSVSRMPPDATFAVFEMGMNHAGEISHLTDIVRPEFAIITAVEKTHLAHFNSIDDIADAKAEIFDSMGPGHVAILNRDNPFCRQLAAAARARGIERIISFGMMCGSDVRLTGYQPSSDGHQVMADVAGTEVGYRLNVAGRHWAMNSLAVLATVHALDQDVARAADALAAMAAPKGRGARHLVPVGDGAVELIDDSYNASPASMRAAIAVLGETGRATNGSVARHRRVAILGDMLELGPDEHALHAELAGDLIAADVDLVFTAGDLMRGLHDALPAERRADHGADSDALVAPVLAALQAGDVVMVKGSAASRMGRVVEAIQEAAASVPADSGQR